MAQENYTEKVSVNMNTSTLSSIDLLVDGGYYSNRSDFINQAVREALLRQQSTVDRIIENRMSATQHSSNAWFIGISGLTQRDLVQMDAEGAAGEITGYGVFHLPEDIDRDMLYRTVTAIRVKGKVIAPQDVKTHYGLK